MSRKINIIKYKDNTHYTVYVYDKYNQEHHVGYLGEGFMTLEEVEKCAQFVWLNEKKNKEDLLNKAIYKMIQHDRDKGMLKNNRDNLD